MTIHNLQLANEPFRAIVDGRKIIESRLYDAKRQAIKLGDELVFTNCDSGETVRAKVVGLLHYGSFAEMFRRNDPSKFGGESAEWLLNQINEFYASEQQAENGVVGIEFELLCGIDTTP